MKTLAIEWQRLLDERLQTCPRCGTTEREVEKAVRELNRELAPVDITVTLVKQSIDAEAFKKDALQSNRILIAGKTLEEWLGAATGQSRCCDVCGDSDCRTIEYDGETHEAIPSDMIVMAGITAAVSLFGIQPPQTTQKISVLKLTFKKIYEED